MVRKVFFEILEEVSPFFCYVLSSPAAFWGWRRRDFLPVQKHRKFLVKNTKRGETSHQNVGPKKWRTHPTFVGEMFSGQIRKSRPKTRVLGPQKVAFWKGNGDPGYFRGNLGWWNKHFIWPDVLGNRSFMNIFMGWVFRTHVTLEKARETHIGWYPLGTNISHLGKKEIHLQKGYLWEGIRQFLLSGVTRSLGKGCSDAPPPFPLLYKLHLLHL